MGEGIHNRNKLLVSFLSWFMIKKRERERGRCRVIISVGRDVFVIDRLL